MHCNRQSGIRLVVLTTVLLALNSAWSAERDLAADALRVLHDHCFGCHNPEDRKGDLSLESAADIQTANREFDLLVDGHPEQSALIQVLAPDADPHMPPKEQLPTATIEILKEWITNGAQWPDRPVAAENQRTLAQRSQLNPLPAGFRPVMAIALSPEEDRLAFGRGNRVIICTQLTAEKPLTDYLSGHRAVVESLAWNPQTPNMLLSGGYRRLVYWDTDAFEPAKIIEAGLDGIITALVFSPDGTFAYAALSRPAGTSQIVQFELPGFNERARWDAHTDTIFALDISPTGGVLASAGGDRSLAFWQTDTLYEQIRIEAHSTQIMTVSFSPDSRRVLTGGTDNQLRVWDWSKGDPLFLLGRHKNGVYAAQWARQGDSIVAAEEHGQVFRYTEIGDHDGAANARAAKEARLHRWTDTIQSLDIDAKGETIFVGTQSGSVHVLNAAGKVVHSLAP